MKFLLQLPGLLLVLVIHLYQKVISPLFPPTCRFTPTCSEYFIKAVRKYGVIWGSVKGIWRILRCHPWNPGGEDEP